jgi:GntR family transcriptional regulator
MDLIKQFESSPALDHTSAAAAAAARRPMYSQVYDLLRRDIEEGVWRPTQAIPTELELGQRFRVSPGTVKQAVLALVRDGLLTRRSGRGTFVRRLDLSQSLMRFFRFHDKDTGAHLAPAITLIGAKTLTEPPAKIAAKLGISKRQRVLKLVRLMTHDSLPVCIHVSYLPGRMVQGLEQEDFTTTTLYRIIDQKFGINVTRAQELLSAVSAKKFESKLLGICDKQPVILIERTAFTYGGVIVEWRRTIGRSDKFCYRTKLP